MSATILTPEFESMLISAKTYFKHTRVKSIEHHQCLILKTLDGTEKIYSFASDSIKELIDQSCSILYQKQVTTVTHILCMWEGGYVDVPSHKFITTLCEMNIENKNAEILLKSNPDSCSYKIKKLSDIIG